MKLKHDKNQRQSRILRLIKEHSIETQEELVRLLNESDVEVTQATVSRDIMDLGIIKVMTGDGQKRYVLMDRSGEGASGRQLNAFRDSVVSIDVAQNFVIIKTLPGMAPGAAAALDSMHLQDFMGSLAGDDTIFVATHSSDMAEAMRDRLIELSQTDPQMGQRLTKS
ncbi:MAG TPA: arginine repressor [Clostridiaceae bacterium]|jgi:transcriptional regulator of arginine metabolism|nr:arginine repressor [Clostridiaceae bacterium]